MRAFLYAVFIVFGLGIAAPVSGQSLQECRDLHAVYGWAPDGCPSNLEVPEKTTAVSPQTQVAVSTTDPTAVQRESHVFFPNGGTGLDRAAREQLAVLAQLLNGQVMGGACLALIGHSDTSGGEIGNMQVSKARANAVATALRTQLSDPQKIERILALGETRPLENLSPLSRWQRRVEIRARNCAPLM